MSRNSTIEWTDHTFNLHLHLLTNWAEPLQWQFHARHTGERHKVFAGSMCDWAEARGDLIEPRRRLWNLIQRTPHLDWILLTKRPENIPVMLPPDWADGWPNVWLMATVECQDTLPRLRKLASVPSIVRGLSMEPLLGGITFGDDDWESGYRPDWIIVGGETGPGARPMHPSWVRGIRDWSGAHGVAFFFKGWGGKSKCRILDGREWNEFPSPADRSRE